MDELNKKECGGCGEGKCGCGGPMGGHMHCHGKHHLVKVILKLIIVILVFWCGYQLGQITGSLRAEQGRGYGMMMHGGYNNMPAVTPANPATPTP